MKCLDTFGEKLRTARKRANLTQKQLAERIGALHNSVSQWECGITRPSQDVVKSLCAALDVTADYLLGIAPAPAKIDGLPTMPNLVSVSTRRVPVLGEIAAGQPITARQNYDEFVDADTGFNCDIALRVAGDSMEPLINKGDLVFLQLQDDVLDGQIAAVIVDESATLKRVYHIPGGLELISANPKYPPMHFFAEDGFSVRIFGRAVSFRRDLH